MKVGANYLRDGKCEFVVWGPLLDRVELKVIAPEGKIISMVRDDVGYWRTVMDEVSSKTLYLYRLNGDKERPDPASFFQPKGVHGPSQVVDHKSFRWEDDDWRGIEISQMIIYELHVGTFTPEGTFEAITRRLNGLAEIGINSVEIMPVAQFPGERNWGYDGVYSFAVQNSYGGPSGLKSLVNECHKNGLAVILDVVYNHLGPEGNYFRDFGPYFTDKYKTPWGNAINFDDAYSDEVRNFFVQNALYWFKYYHIDALRLDAIHAIYDLSARHILEELSQSVEKLSVQERRKFFLIAESALNDSRVIKPREIGGYGIDAQWSDDFHHSLRTLLTGESDGYYVDFGKTEHLVKAFREGFVYSGQYSADKKRKHGNSSEDRPGRQFIVFSQNHDQIGNRLFGERLTTFGDFEGLKLVAAAVLFSPYVPLLFMGEEYGEQSPFLYFVSHSDPDLIGAVRKGRSEEFQSFNWKEAPPDPQSIDTFLKSKINWEKREQGANKVLLNYYRELIKFRGEFSVLSNLNKKSLNVHGYEKEKVVFMRRWNHDCNSQVFLIFNFNKADLEFSHFFPEGRWRRVLDSSEKKWDGPGSNLPEEMDSENALHLRRLSFTLYEKK